MNETQHPVMIFHVAYPLSASPRSASSLRPVRMRQAFEELGYEVLEISGTHPERRARIADLKRRVRAGLRVEFVYSEAATTPTGLGEKVTPSTSLTRDIAFLRFCQRRGIPVGLFYRDIYWRFPIYEETLRQPRLGLYRALYRWELRRYRRAELRVYVPSEEMMDWVPVVPRERMRALPPGGDPRDDGATPRSDDAVDLLYVGGLGSNYRLHRMVSELAGRDGIRLTLCVPESHWEARKHEYLPLLAPNIRVVHESGAGLDALYAGADIGMIAVEPIAYWGFAAPVKLFEYLSRGKPIIASNGTYSGRFTACSGFGWSLEYGSGELGELLDELRAHPGRIDEAAQRVLAGRSEHSWRSRAAAVVEDLAHRDPRSFEGAR